MTEQSKDYARGYAAGSRREHREERERDRTHQITMARYTLAAAIAPGVIANPWETGGKRHTSVTQISGTIVDLVHAIERKL